MDIQEKRQIISAAEISCSVFMVRLTALLWNEWPWLITLPIAVYLGVRGALTLRAAFLNQ